MPGFNKPPISGKEIFSKVKTYLKRNRDLDKQAANEMDKIYPSGWAHSSVNINQMNKIRKELKKRLR